MSEQTQETERTATDEERGTRKVLRGVVVSDAGDKTITVAVSRLSRHRLYHKTIALRRKFYAHDEQNEARVGDKVELMGTRPLSKKKRWRLVRIIEKAPQD